MKKKECDHFYQKFKQNVTGKRHSPIILSIEELKIVKLIIVDKVVASLIRKRISLEIYFLNYTEYLSFPKKISFYIIKKQIERKNIKNPSFPLDKVSCVFCEPYQGSKCYNILMRIFPLSVWRFDIKTTLK